MPALSPEELIEILVESGLDRSAIEPGTSEAAPGEAADPVLLDVPFADLGVDSVMLLDSAARIERKSGIVLEDDLLTSIPTPRLLLESINARTVA